MFHEYVAGLKILILCSENTTIFTTQDEIYLVYLPTKSKFSFFLYSTSLCLMLMSQHV